MIYLSDKLRGAPSHKFLPVSALNLIFMARGIDPAGVGSELDVNLAEIADAPDKQTLRSKVRAAFGTTLGLLALSGTAACAQDAPKTQLVANNTAAAPAKTTPVSASDADLFALPANATSDDSDLFALPKTPKRDIKADIAAANKEADAVEMQVAKAKEKLKKEKGRLGEAIKRNDALGELVEDLKEANQPDI